MDKRDAEMIKACAAALAAGVEHPERLGTKGPALVVDRIAQLVDRNLESCCCGQAPSASEG